MCAAGVGITALPPIVGAPVAATGASARLFAKSWMSQNFYCTKPLRGSRPTSAGDFCIGPEVSLIGLFERHGKFFDCGPGVRTEATPPHKRLRRLLDQHTDSVRKPLHAGVPRQPEEWRKPLSV
jgi:hypothetical protein